MGISVNRDIWRTVGWVSIMVIDATTMRAVIVDGGHGVSALMINDL